jgi:urate oxidase
MDFDLFIPRLSSLSMSIILSHNNYGKSRVRLVKVNRSKEAHELKDLNFSIQLEGDFEAAHTKGDNSKILPTDTMKNTVYALARKHDIVEIESFALLLAEHFLTNNPQVSHVSIKVKENIWRRIKVDGRAHPHAFIQCGDEKRTTEVNATREKKIISSGIEDLLVLKTTDSGFVGFIKDQYTTLPEVTDRIFATVVKASWVYVEGEINFNESWNEARQLLIETFAAHDSLSVQQTLYAMGNTVLESRNEIAEISLSLPNKHCLPVDLMVFGIDNPNEVFQPVDEPHGLIEATLKRA